MDQRVELLAPAGNMAGFYGAIHAGADAVYLGGKRFGARAYADNFTEEELLVCLRYAHILGRRVYLTVNTLVKEAEFDAIAVYLSPLYEAGLDGVIVQDIGVFCFIRDHFPGLELHVSTQMMLTGSYGAKLLKEMGAVRVVPARELSLAELKALKAESGLQVEAFIHGAMCYCYSGQCLFSSMLGGRSGNRGRCAQPCRLPYRPEAAHLGGAGSGVCYPLSLKDLCTVEHIPELIGAGIDSFKIEGRMKKPEYAAGVTAVYRKYIDRYYAGKDCTVEAADLQVLGGLYIRSGRQDGYYNRHNGRDMVALQNPSYGECSEALSRQIRETWPQERRRIAVDLEAELLVGRPARVVLNCKRPEGVLSAAVSGDVTAAAQRQPVTEENVRRQLGKLGDTFFAARDIDLELDENAFYPLKGLNELRRQAVEQLEALLIGANGLPAGREGIEQTAIEQTVMEQTSMRRISRAQISVEQTSVAREESGGEESGLRISTGSFHVCLRTAEQLQALAETAAAYPKFARVCLEADLVYEMLYEAVDAGAGDRVHFLKLLEGLRDGGCVPVIALPPVIRKRDQAFLEKIWEGFWENCGLFGGFLVRSMDGLGYVTQMSQNKQRETGASEKEGANPADAMAAVKVYGDAGISIWNRESLRALQRTAETDAVGGGIHMLDGFCMPYELNGREQQSLLGAARIPCEKIVYGRIPLMITANCVVNTVYGCKGGGDPACFLTDRYQKRFPVLANCRHCMNTIYNSLPLSLHKEFSKWRDRTDFRLDFTIEDGRETVRILHYFLSGAAGEPPYREYTAGHEKRGAE